MSPFINRNVCFNCPFKDEEDIERCKKTNCRYINSWFVYKLEDQIIIMQGEINDLNGYIKKLTELVDKYKPC